MSSEQIKFKCTQCGNDSFFKESDTVTRCNACFTRVTATEFNIDPFSQKVNPDQNGGAGINKKYIKYGGILVAFLLYYIISQYALESFRNNFLSTNQITSEEEAQEKTEITMESIESKDIPSENFVISELTPLPDLIGNIYFAGYIQNIGEIPSEKPKIELTFYDKKNNVVKTTFGYATKDILDVNEKSMINILLEDAPKYDRFESKISATKLYYDRKNPKIEIIQSKIVTSENGLKLIGKIKNINDFTIQYINVTLIMRNKDRKIIHFSDHYISDETLRANKELAFEFELYVSDLGQTSHEINLQATKKD